MARMTKEAQRQNGIRSSPLVPHEGGEQDGAGGNERCLNHVGMRRWSNRGLRRLR
jgi:hypothetical protein